MKKYRNLLKKTYKRFLKKQNTLSSSLQDKILKNLKALEEAILSKNREEAKILSVETENYLKHELKPSLMLRFIELIGALSVALLFAIVIRQMWFELYEIPTGSMRPHFKEHFALTVSKTQFGINVPLATKHLYFDEKEVKRGKVVVFSGDGIDLPSTDESYFGIIPYTKRYIKRLIGKPGDHLFFYGGTIYGIDQEGNNITELQTDPWVKNIEYIPVLSFEGTQKIQDQNTITLNQFNLPTLLLKLNPDKTIQSTPQIKNWPHFAGINGFAMAKLGKKGEEVLLLLKHSPFMDSMSGLPSATVSAIPLFPEELDQIRKNLSTDRFIVKDQEAFRYGSPIGKGADGLFFEGVKNGTYEIINGVAYRVALRGWAFPLPASHPLNNLSTYDLISLFNGGIRFHTKTLSQNEFPARFAYFNQGDLYLFGKPLILKDDPRLTNLNGWKDQGVPTKETILKYGVKVPDGHYVVLGDNHPISADSRVFGFVPEANIQGVPSFILWPPGPMWGFPAQTPYSTFTLPRLIIWSVAFILFLIIWGYYRWKNKQRLIR